MGNDTALSKLLKKVPSATSQAIVRGAKAVGKAKEKNDMEEFMEEASESSGDDKVSDKKYDRPTPGEETLSRGAWVKYYRSMLVGSGSRKTKPNQVHHYSTNKNKKYTPQIENITKKYGLELDDDWNKELLSHQGRHPNEYHEYVLEKLNEYDVIAQGDKTKFLKLYEQLKGEARNNPDMLYKDYWRNK